MSEREQKAAQEIEAAMRRGGSDAIILCILNHLSDSKGGHVETYWLAEIVRYACAMDKGAK